MNNQQHMETPHDVNAPGAEPKHQPSKSTVPPTGALGKQNVRLSERLSTALEYAERDWPVFPVHYPIKRDDGMLCSCGQAECRAIGKHPTTLHGFKDATTDPAKIRKWWHREPYNIGLPTGASGFFVLDEDPRNGGDETLAELERKHGKLPETLTSHTGGGGRHFFFRYPEGGTIKSGEGVLGAGLDIKGDGGYVVAPPSLHKTDKKYEWELCADTGEEADIVEAPAWLLDKLRPAPKTSKTSGEAAGNNGGPIMKGERNNTLFRIGCSQRKKGKNEKEIAAGLLQVNEKWCQPPLEKKEVRRITENVMKYEPGAEGGRADTDLTDHWNGRLFAEMHRGKARYSYQQKSWYVYGGRCWNPDDMGGVARLAKEATRKIYRLASEAESDSRAKALGKHARSSSSKNQTQAMLFMAQSELAISPDQFDKNPFLLNVENGTIDLRTGELRKHRAEDFLSKLAPVNYDPAAKSPLWEGFLNTVFEGNKNLVDYFQLVVGYSLSGDVRHDCFFILFGPGSNGKTTALNTVAAMLGDYARTMPPNFLTKTRHTRHPTERMEMRGTRFMHGSEVPEDSTFDELQVKALSGGDRIKARGVCRNFIEFDPTHKFLIAVNHLPTIYGTDPAIWRRVRVIPFNARISKPDESLRLRLSDELSGILAWAVEGAVRWYEGEGQGPTLPSPSEVLDAVEEYRGRVDYFFRFLNERCILDPVASCPAGELFQAFEGWCRAEDIQGKTQTAFGRLLAARGFPAKKSSAGMIIRLGLKLKGGENEFTEGYG